MKLPNHGRRAVALLYGLLLLTVPVIYGQTSTTGDKSTQTNEPAPRRWSIGLRVRTLPARSLSVMDNGTTMNTTTVSKVNYDWNYTTTSKSFVLGGGAAFEMPISARTIFTAEVIFNRLRYDKVTNEYWGTDDPTTATDERSHYTATEDTKARLFDVPLLLHRNVRATGMLSHLYLSGGVTVRNASSVRTVNNITNADGTLANNQTQAPVDKRTLLGATVGAGFRFVDEFNIKVTPEIRFTRWNGPTFNQDSTLSPRNQFEVGIGFSR